MTRHQSEVIQNVSVKRHQWGVVLNAIELEAGLHNHQSELEDVSLFVCGVEPQGLLCWQYLVPSPLKYIRLEGPYTSLWEAQGFR